jgi:hypothetical protein
MKRERRGRKRERERMCKKEWVSLRLLLAGKKEKEKIKRNRELERACVPESE